jgi:hypothetical protein
MPSCCLHCLQLPAPTLLAHQQLACHPIHSGEEQRDPCDSTVDPMVQHGMSESLNACNTIQYQCWAEPRPRHKRSEQCSAHGLWHSVLSARSGAHARCLHTPWVTEPGWLQLGSMTEQCYVDCITVMLAACTYARQQPCRLLCQTHCCRILHHRSCSGSSTASGSSCAAICAPNYIGASTRTVTCLNGEWQAPQGTITCDIGEAPSCLH